MAVTKKRCDFLDGAKCITDGSFVTTGWMGGGNEMPYNYPCWFLCVLVLCYISFYVICKFSGGGYTYFLIGMVLFGYAAMRLGWEFPFCYRTNGEGYMNFYLGCLLFEWSERISGRQKKTVVAVILFSFLILLIGSRRIGFETFSGDVRLVMTYICMSVIFICRNVNMVGRVFSIYPFQCLGKLNMHYFLFQVPLLTVMKEIESRTGIYRLDGRKGLILFLLILTVFCLILQRVECGRAQKNKTITS